MLPRPLMMRISRKSCSSFTELAVGLTERSGLGCWAPAGMASAITPRSAKAPIARRRREASFNMLIAPLVEPLRAGHHRADWPLRLDRFPIGRQPAPGAGAVAALRHPV